jgi:hypothetical protein
MAESATAQQFTLRNPWSSADTSSVLHPAPASADDTWSQVLTYIVPPSGISVTEARRIVKQADEAMSDKIVDRFVERLASARDISEVWRIRDADPLELAVMVKHSSLDRDLEIRAIFADIVRDFDATLNVFDSDEMDAELGRKGDRLIG